MPQESNQAPDTTWVFKQFVFEEVLRDLDDHFKKLNIDYMPIKGAYLICSGLAGQIQYRPMSDIDALVCKSSFEAVISYFSTIPNISIAPGSWPINKKGSPFEVTFTVAIEGRELMVDIHHSLNLHQRFVLPTEQVFARGIHLGHRILPCAEDALVICLCHGFSHAGHIFSDVLFEDVVFLANTKIDWVKFWDIAASTGIAAFMHYILKRFERKRKIQAVAVYKKTLKFAYAEFLLAVFGNNDLSKLPALLRRIIIELPFCRNPVGLFLNKFKNLVR